MSNPLELDTAPGDAISSVRFSSTGDHLLAASWDRTISVYRRDASGSPTYTLERCVQCRAPILDACWGADDSTIFAVGLDQDVRRIDLSEPDNDDNQTVLSTHGSASNKIAYSKTHNVLVSTSWDSTIHIHNLAASEGRSFVRVAVKAKPFALALTDERIVVAMAERYISIYDIRALRMLSEQTESTKTSPEDENEEALHITPWQERESSLRFMTRAVTTIPDGTGFVTSSIEGRVGVDWFAPEDQSKTYAFKCHRQTVSAVGDDGLENDVDVVYPVNALTFNPVHTTSFVTAGGDGVIAVWDAVLKRRIKLYPKLSASIAAVDFSPDGKLLVIGVSPGFEDGQEDAEIDQSQVKIFIREFAEGELKGKGK